MTNGQETAGPGDVALSAEKPNGPVVAATLSVGVSAVALGAFTTLAEASTSVKDFLNFYDPVGPLAGKTTYAVIIYMIAWAGLHMALKDRDLPWKPFIQATTVLFIISLVLTYPPFFQMFAPAE